MSEFTLTDPKTGDEFTLQGPDGMTLEQAQAIFKQQVDAGSLVGFREGDTVSAVTQAAGGSTAAVAALAQTFGSVTGKLPPGTDLNTISTLVGPGGLAAQQQTQIALQGSIAGIASLTTGSSAAVNAALTTPPLPTFFIPGVSNLLTEPLTGQLAQAESIANISLSTLEKALKILPLNGITTADFAKQASALESIENLSQNNVTGTLAQANKLVGQTAVQFSNSLGVGKYGLDANQLERTGYLKPGVSSSFVNLTGSNLIDVLKSPVVWTEKNNIKSLTDLLINSAVQDKIQQELMKAGLTEISQLGIPIDKLIPAVLSGIAVCVAKSVPATFAWLTGSPYIPPITTVPQGDVASAFSSIITNCAFAIKMTTDKIENALKQETDVIPAVDTINSDTVKAASLRIIGNDKVSPVSDGGNTQNEIKLLTIFNWSTDINSALEEIDSRILEYQKTSSISQAQWNKLNSDFQVIKSNVSSNGLNYQQDASNIVSLETSKSEKEFLLTIYQKIVAFQQKIDEYIRKIKTELTALTNKISI